MTAKVPNPGNAGLANLKSVGKASYTAAGNYSIQPPAAAKFIRFELRGGGSGGSAAVGNPNSLGNGGGEGALQRRFLPVTQAALALVIGAGGAGGSAGAAGGSSTFVGYTAAGGATGGLGGKGDLAPVVGPGFGSFSGYRNVGAFGGLTGGYSAGVLGGGGSGGAAGGGNGGAGGDGYCFIEFFG